MNLLFYTNSHLLSTGFLSVFSGVRGFSCSTVSGPVTQLLAEVARQCPELLLIDAGASDHFEALLALRRSQTHCHIVLWVDAIHIETAYQAMQLGVRGILRKSDPLDQTIRALEEIAQGNMWFEKEMANRFLGSRTIELTPRESQLIPLVARGLKNKEIAFDLRIAEATVRIYLSTLFRKLGVRDRYELAIYALKHIPAVGLEDCFGNTPADKSRALPLRSILLSPGSEKMRTSPRPGKGRERKVNRMAM
jgi:DNA-binding NarL/FixJ family response regulator